VGFVVRWCFLEPLGRYLDQAFAFSVAGIVEELVVILEPTVLVSVFTGYTHGSQRPTHTRVRQTPDPGPLGLGYPWVTHGLPGYTGFGTHSISCKPNPTFCVLY